MFFSTSSLLAIPDVYKNCISQYTNHQIPNSLQQTKSYVSAREDSRRYQAITPGIT